MRWIHLGILLLVGATACSVDLTDALDNLENYECPTWRVEAQGRVENAAGEATIIEYSFAWDGIRSDWTGVQRFDPPRSRIPLHGTWRVPERHGPHSLTISILDQTASPSAYRITDVTVSVYEHADLDDVYAGGSLVTTKTIPGRTVSLVSNEIVQLSVTL